MRNRSAGRSTVEGPGSRIGPYKLLQPIGEGGMGTVYMAEQTEPVRRMVALKLIKAGMDSRQVLARFGAERQALALMDHPNIAKVFDAGTTDGLPYFVMELVKGIPITKFCDERRLTTRERLELAIPVCQAVQHAHQKGIIHRDLKPSNVLIALYDGKPVPKVIDFGVAKATGPRLTDQTLVHRVRGGGRHARVHEPRAGPAEPARHRHPQRHLQPGRAPLRALDRLDAAGSQAAEAGGDSGNAAGDPRGGVAPAEHCGLATTEELPSIAACRNIEPRKLSGLVRGELDWIVMKALEKDRNRRYETANGLAADLRRYLDDEPVQACPPSAWYRFGKFARRNKVGSDRGRADRDGDAVRGLGMLAVSNVLITREKNQEAAPGPDGESERPAGYRRRE